MIYVLVILIRFIATIFLIIAIVILVIASILIAKDLIEYKADQLLREIWGKKNL